ncbi:MAG: DUF4435 domain-containing protein [Syntrophales bacterium]
MIKWPKNAIAAIQKLFEPLQPIDVYVEDTTDEVFYRALLNRVSNGRVHFARVFGLGGRQAVVEAAGNHDHSKRRALFIVDGDLEWVRGLPAPKIPCLHRHEAYCVENLLFCEQALAQILSQEAILTEADALRVLDFRTWIGSVQDPLVELFAAFAVVHEFAPEIQTVAQGVGHLCTNRRTTKKFTILDRRKTSHARMIALQAAEAKAAKCQVAEAYRRNLMRIKSLKFPLHAVSGKDFILPLVDFLLQARGCRIRRKSLRIRMAISGDSNRFSDLYCAIRDAASG